MSGFNHPKPFKPRKDEPRDDPDWEIGFFEGIVQNSPNHVDALVNLGNLYTKRGEFVKGLEVDKRLVRLRPEDPIIHYNLACSLSLVGHLEAALDELKKTVELGYSDYDYMLTDEDLGNIRKDPRFCEFVERLVKRV